MNKYPTYRGVLLFEIFPMRRHVLAFALIAVVGCGVAYFFFFLKSSTPSSTVHLTVIANETTIYGRPWDGIRMGGAFRSVVPELPTQSPPDIAICTIQISKSKTLFDCYHKGDTNNPISYCHDSYECTFSIPSPAGSSIGIIVYDIDAVFGSDKNDLIDVFLLRNGTDDLQPIVAATRDAVSLISTTDMAIPSWIVEWAKNKAPRQTPNWLSNILNRGMISVLPSEALRRESDYKVFERIQCHDGCRLSQSTIMLK